MIKHLELRNVIREQAGGMIGERYAQNHCSDSDVRGCWCDCIESSITRRYHIYFELPMDAKIARVGIEGMYADLEKSDDGHDDKYQWFGSFLQKLYRFFVRAF